MPTPAEINENLENLYNGWLESFSPLYTCVRDLRTNMFKRIFGTGRNGGANQKGDKLPVNGYSAKEMYIDARSLRSAPNQFKIGKRGTAIKSLYFPEGYAQLKKETNAKLPLELTGRLKGGFIGEPIRQEGLQASILMPESERKKVEGLEKQNGIIFLPTIEEQKAFLECHAAELVEMITRAINE